jgi:3-deoxy-D-manno-octulosonic-acid transferase
LRYIYNVLIYLAMPFLFLRLLWRSRRAPDYRKRWAERVGFCPYQLSECIWVHAVSVGETIAAIPLIKALKKQYPDIPLLVTNMTPTGAARVKAALGDSVLQAYIPYDFPDAVDRFLDRVKPMVAVIMETELWPNLFAKCKAREIPLVVTNARLSEKSAAGYRRIAPLTREMLSAVKVLASQGKADAERFIELGMPAEKVVVTGNLKFDIEPPAELAAKSETLRTQLGQERLIWVAASTHPTEEEIILSAHKKILAAHPQALLILVPRHPERFDSVAQLAEQQGNKVARRSRSENCSPEVNVYLGDTMGELLLMYAVCDVAFVAGSFAQVGGHNMLEAAVLKKPIVMGPQLYNFAEISQMLIDTKGMLVVQDGDELAETITQLFSDKNQRETIGENAYRVVDANRGSLQKQVQLIIKAF